MNKNLNLINSLKSKENNSVIKLFKKIGLQKLGLMTSQAWYDDPKMLLFILARYKFVSKMFSGLKSVLEVGCGDAFASRIVRQTVAKLDVSDHDPDLISEAKSRDMKKWKMEYLIHNMIFRSTKKKYDGIYLLDVLEHIDKNKEKKFMKNICRSLKKMGKL